MVWTLGTFVAGMLLHPLLQKARTQGWCKFAKFAPDAYYLSVLQGEAAALDPSLEYYDPEVIPSSDGNNDTAVKLQRESSCTHRGLEIAVPAASLSDARVTTPQA